MNGSAGILCFHELVGEVPSLNTRVNFRTAVEI
ncbi:MAG: hypothetical protein ACI9DC_001168 [Gammaproteobacteria bacterium]|jgi:hypothetical protein